MVPSSLFPEFQHHRVEAGPVTIDCVVGGAGPPLLLLHGYPQNRSMWHAVAPILAESFTVVASDLRGYGASDKPPSGENHAAYSKRAMAADQVALMAALGFDRFDVAGHDRGGRVAHRMALDHPSVVGRLAVLDIVATRTVFATTDMELARSYYHWFFLIQPPGFPERLIGADPDFYLDHTLRSWSGPGTVFHPDALTSYRSAFRDPATIAASCEDYRAAAGIDLEHDRADTGPLMQPLLVMWGTQGAMDRRYDVPGTWRDLATDVTGCPIACGHFLAEEAPAETAAALDRFFRPSLDEGA
jgi:haloacetate dehalogenase